MTRKMLCVVLALMMVFSLAACSKEEAVTDTSEVETTTKEETKEESKEKESDVETEASSEETEASSEENPFEEEVTLVFLSIGDEPNDMDIVEEAANKILLEKFNTKIDLQFTTWTDFGQKYENALLTEGCDMCYGAVWQNYGTLAKQGAYMELDDLLNTYAPDLVAAIDENRLNGARVGGKLYGFPCMMPSYTTYGFAYRKDLADKYNLPYPEGSLENVEAYFNGVAEHREDEGLIAVIPNSGASGVSTWNTAGSPLERFLNPGRLNMKYGYLYDMHDPSQLEDYWFSDKFVEDMQYYKKWCDAGWWSRSAASAEYTEGQLPDGLVACLMNGTNVTKWSNWVRNAAEKGNDNFEIAWYDFSEFDGNSYPAHPTQNLTCIAASCKYPERATLVLQEIMLNQELNDIIQCGIEGVHYNIDENGFYVATEQGTNNYPYEGADTWNFMNKSWRMHLESDAEVEAVWARNEEVGDKTLYPNTNIVEGFSFNPADFDLDAEDSAVSNVVAEKLGTIYMGLVDDPAAAIDDFRAALKDAGVEKIREVYKAEWEAYCEEFGYTASDK